MGAATEIPKAGKDSVRLCGRRQEQWNFVNIAGWQEDADKHIISAIFPAPLIDADPGK